MNHASFDPVEYWRRTLRRILLLLAIWALAGPILSILFVDTLNHLTLGGIPLGFWMGQQGSIYVFVLLIFLNAWLADRQDREFGVDETPGATQHVDPGTLPIVLFLLFAGAGVAGAQEERPVWPAHEWPRAEAAELGLDLRFLDQAVSHGRTGAGSGMVIKGGHVVAEWGDLSRRYDLKSTSKSIGMTAVGLALADGKLRLEDRASSCHPSFGVPPEENRGSGWVEEVTLVHLATQTAGFAKPGGYQPLLFRPGTAWHYSDSGPNWLAECVTVAYGRDVEDVLFERVFEPIGIERSDLRWRANQYRPHEIEGIPRREFGSGVHGNVDALARIGYLYLHDGVWDGRRLLPEGFVDLLSSPHPTARALATHPESEEFGPGAAGHYGLLWWNNADGALDGVPTDAFWSWGLYDSFIIVVPSLDLVVVRAGERDLRTADWMGHYDRLEPFLGPIVAAVRNVDRSLGPSRSGGAAPYPPSRALAIEWAPPDSVIRLAPGSDNWPATWGDDGHLYTAYGDGWGFEPRVPEKLSLGIARVEGSPPDPRGYNIRSETAERLGDGLAGEKASGMLMVDGVLYMWVRNTGNSQLAWSADRGRTWTWAGWKFITSFGAPTFLNFGRNYQGARDGYVYVYSHDSDSAYEPADRMVLARVPKDRIRERDAYEFFTAVGADGAPGWTRDLDRRGAVFWHPGRAYRSGISYNPALRRYLWYHTMPWGEERYEGGMGLYDAPEPWGPWTTLDYAELWDVGPGESGNLPTKWMSEDGRTVHLVFSGHDHFAVRRARLTPLQPEAEAVR